METQVLDILHRVILLKVAFPRPFFPFITRKERNIYKTSVWCWNSLTHLSPHLVKPITGYDRFTSCTLILHCFRRREIPSLVLPTVRIAFLLASVASSRVCGSRHNTIHQPTIPSRVRQLCIPNNLYRASCRRAWRWKTYAVFRHPADTAIALPWTTSYGSIYVQCLKGAAECALAREKQWPNPSRLRNSVQCMPK